MHMVAYPPTAKVDQISQNHSAQYEISPTSAQQRRDFSRSAEINPIDSRSASTARYSLLFVYLSG